MLANFWKRSWRADFPSCNLLSPFVDLAGVNPAFGPEEFFADLPTPWLDNSS